MVRHRISGLRLAGLMALFCIMFAAVGWRVYDVAYLRHSWYAEKSSEQVAGDGRVFTRGSISLSDQGRRLVVAQNRREPAVFASSDRIPASERLSYAERLAQLLGATPAQVERSLDIPSGQSRVIARRLSDDAASAVKALKLAGITVALQPERVYPAGALAADVVGYYGHGSDGEAGQYGIEAQFDGALSGASSPQAPSSVLGHLGALINRGGGAAADPSDIELTIDKNIQAFVADALNDTLRKYRASSGTILVQEPRTGRLLAMADSPSFDPNSYGSYPVGSFLNGAVQQSFEPGSSFKPFTMALGIEEGVITPASVFHDDGDVVVDGYTIKNFNEQHFGRVTMAQVLEKSINTGVMHVQKLVGNERFLRGVEDLGFGQKTGIDLPGELAGDVGNLYTGRRINFLTASFGQGITVTPLQLAVAYSAIANGGKLMRPYVVESVTDARGNRTVTQPEVAGTPFRASTATAVSTMLVSVVDKGFDKARIARYDVAGKTGTAQIASPEGGYVESQYNHSFAGFAPASDPRFTIVIRMERPQGVTFAADSLSPVFRDISLFLLNYLNVPPTR